MECRAYGICLDSQSRGYLGKDRKVSSAAGGNLSRMHKTEETAKESRLNFMYSHLRNRTLVNLRAHWDRVPVPGNNGQKVSESEFYNHTPGNNKYLINYHVVPLGETTPPPGLKANENRAVEANMKENHPDYSFYTSEHNDGHEDRFCHNGDYNPDEIRPSTGREA